MSEEVTESNPTSGNPVKQYVFNVAFKQKGFVSSDWGDIEKLKAQFKTDFDMYYGEDGYELLEFREATEEETAQFVVDSLSAVEPETETVN